MIRGQSRRAAGLAVQVNVATALHRLARLHCTSSATNAATIIVTSAQFRLLLAAIRKLLPRFEVRRPLTPASRISAPETSMRTLPLCAAPAVPLAMHRSRAPGCFSPDATPRPPRLAVDAPPAGSDCPLRGRSCALFLALHADVQRRRLCRRKQ